MQVETESNMKSQVAGVRRASDEADPGRKNKKRIKLAHNSEENSSGQIDSNNVENLSYFENVSNNSDRSELSDGHLNDVQENGHFLQKNGQFTDVQENEHFIHKNGQFTDVQENNQSDNLHFNGSSSNVDELNYMENMNNDVVNRNSFFQNESDGELNPMVNGQSEYRSAPTLKTHHSDDYQYASNSFDSVKETVDSSITSKESNKIDCTTYSKNEYSYTPANDSEETIIGDDDHEMIQPSNYETPSIATPEIVQSSISETPSTANPEIAQSSISETVSSNDPGTIQLSNSETILRGSNEKSQSSCSETILKSISVITTKSSHENLQIPSCSYESNFSKPDKQPLSIVNQDDVKYLGIYDLKTTQLEGHADVIFSVAADDQIVISSSGDTTIKMWDVENQKELCTFSGHSDAVTAILLLNPNQSKNLCKKLGYSDVSSIVISASMDCHFKVWSAFDAKELSSVYTYNSITCIGYLQSELCVVIGTEGGKLEVWDLLEKKVVESTFAHESSVTGLEVQENYVFSISNDGAVKVWLFEDGELLPLYCRRRRDTSQNGADLGPSQWKSIAVNGDILYLGDNTPYLKTLNWRIGRLKLLVNQLESIGECDAMLAKENILLSTSYNSSTDTAAVNVWSLPDMMYIGTLSGDIQDIYCLALTQFENKLRIISGGHQLTVWDFNLKEPPKENSNTSFSFCELDGLGTEACDKPIEHTIPVNVSSSNFKEKKENQGHCIIL